MNLEEEFDKAMWGMVDEIQNTFHKVPSRFLQMLSKQGGVAAAKQLLAMEKPSSGFTTLWESKRFDLSVEAYVLKPHFRSLFTDEERQVAKDRLTAYGYKIGQEPE